MSPIVARQAWLGATAIAAAALGLGTWLYLDTHESRPPDIRGYVLAEPRALPRVALVDEHDARFEVADFVGHWSILYFGYTYCPDVCPLTLVEVASAKRLLETAGFAAPVEYYLVSVDPKRDTPARLREYVAYFDSDFHGLSGPPQALAELAAATQTVFDVPEGQDAEHYLVSHSSNVVLLDPRGRLYAVFTPPHDSATLAADFTKVAAHYDLAR